MKRIFRVLRSVSPQLHNSQINPYGQPGRAGRSASRMAGLRGREPWTAHVLAKEKAVTFPETLAASLAPVMASAVETPPSQAEMPPTLADVARLAGVSSATAS